MKKITFLIVFIFCSVLNAQNLVWDWVQTNGDSSFTNYFLGSVVDNQGNVYVHGRFDDTTLNLGTVTLNNNLNGGYQVFIAKYSISGALLWGKTFVHDDFTYITALTVDSNDNLLIAGTFYGDSISFDNITLESSYFFNSPAFITKLSSEGTVIWARGPGTAFAETTGYAQPSAIATDNDGNVYVCGNHGFTDFIIDDEISLISSGLNNFFLIKYNADGIVQWARKANNPTNVYTGLQLRMALDNNGDVYLASNFTSSITFDPDTTLTNFFHPTNIYVIKYNDLGEIQFANQYPSSGVNYLAGIALDSNDNLYIYGSYQEGTMTFGSITLSYSFPSDLFLVKLDSSGNAVWAKKEGANSFEQSTGLAVTDDYIYITGNFSSSNMTLGSFILNNPIGTGNVDTQKGFVAQYDLDGNVIGANAPQNTGRNNFASISAKNNNLYVSGFFANSITFGNTTLTANNYNCFVAKLNFQNLGTLSYDATTFSLYPNPARDILFVSSTSNYSKNYSISDVLGRVVKKGETEEKIDISSLQIGQYIMTIEGKSVKFLKQ